MINDYTIPPILKEKFMMTEREKMLAGQLYDCGDEELLTQWHKAKDLVRDFNRTDSADSREKPCFNFRR